MTEKLFMCQMFMCLFRPLKTKAPQMVTLQVTIECGQKSNKKTAHSSQQCSCLPPAPKLPSNKKKQLNFHLQCYHLQCFSFARSKSWTKKMDQEVAPWPHSGRPQGGHCPLGPPVWSAEQRANRTLAGCPWVLRKP